MKKKKNIYGDKVGPVVIADNKFSLDNMDLDRRDIGNVQDGSYDPFYKVNVRDDYPPHRTLEN